MSHSGEGPVWVLADDRTGDVAQCMGVAEALGWPFLVKDIAYEKSARLHNFIRGRSLVGIQPQSVAQLVPPWPRLVIACGRRTAPVARWIKKHSGAFCVQIMDPGMGGRSDIDLFAVPAHDNGRGLPEAKTLRILGAPHRVTPARLAEEAPQWRARWAGLPRPWVALIVGGAILQPEFPVPLAEALAKEVSGLAASHGGSVLVTTSRRTSPAAEEALVAAIQGPSFVHRWRSGGENPFFGMIALADAIVVTGDSTSMCTEATLCKGPVYIWSPPGWVGPKHARLHSDLIEGGYARPLDGSETLAPWDHPSLNSAQAISAAIRERVG